LHDVKSSPSRFFEVKAIRRIVFSLAVVVFVVAAVVAATDARHYGKLTDNIYRFVPITVRPQDTDRFHGIDERISVQDYERCVRFYVQLIENSQPRRRYSRFH
jgi:carboxypeptidase PM20D1